MKRVLVEHIALCQPAGLPFADHVLLQTYSVQHRGRPRLGGMLNYYYYRQAA